MRRLLPLTALVVLVLSGCASEGIDTGKEPRAAAGLKVATNADLAGRLEAWRAEAGVPGLGAAVLRGDDLEVAVAGKRRIDRDAPLAPADTFHLGSDTKAMTASIVARLVDRGLLRWDEPLADAMPDITDMDPAFKTVTLDMLLRHVSGLAGTGAFTDEFTQGFDEAWPLPRQRAWMARRFLSRPPALPPGTKFTYSNYGYLILGHVVERTTGLAWEDLVKHEVFEPLGMTGCGFGPTATDKEPAGNWAHDVKDGAYVATGEDNAPLIGPAGTVHCTLESWARFARAHANPDAGGWLTPASMAHLHEGRTFEGVPGERDIALGWAVTRTDPPRLTHSGSNGYNVAQIVVIPETHAAVLVVANAGDDRARAVGEKVRDALVDQLLGGAKK